LFLFLSHLALANQVDIHGPAGSGAFGTTVAVLPNGNFVVADPFGGPVSQAGAVYLYSPAATLVSTLTGSHINDHVGSGGFLIVGNGNFVVLSPNWKNGGASAAGAVTWVNGTTGLSGTVSLSNSLVGTAANDHVGQVNNYVVLANGNYVIGSDNWHGGKGAVTWGDGNHGVTGAVSSANSLVGSNAIDYVGFEVVPLTNGNYVAFSQFWNGDRGAATWGNGSTGTTGTVSSSNSLVGSTAGDDVGYYVNALSNGNYVVSSVSWNGGLGAATWGDGATGITGAVSATNSLVGSSAGDDVGQNVVPLTNGNYVVSSSSWNASRGAATWGNGAIGTVGTISSSNSLVGTNPDEFVGVVQALTNGNYVVLSSAWNNYFGAATWGDGASGVTGEISAANSLVGANSDDLIGTCFAALSNGNYVVGSETWNGNLGAATWADGAVGATGTVSPSNSLVGTSPYDEICVSVLALSNGNYVVLSQYWNGDIGAATWADGSVGMTGIVSASNSLTGTVAGDRVGTNATALANGDYVLQSPVWNSGTGAATWSPGTTGRVGVVSTDNSFVGNAPGQNESYQTFALPDGNYVIENIYWNSNAGALTMGNGSFALVGTTQPWNSVLNTSGSNSYAYDVTRKRLVVGRSYANTVSLFTMDQIFANNFE
jgi:hypothetical protein